jgi:ABC-2 type transport system ATP-binding protein
MDDGEAIRVDGVYKDFMLPHERVHSLKSAFTGVLKGKKGRTVERQHALENISFTIKKGEFFGIVGRNGSGKSTLLKIIAQIYKPTKGKISVNGRLIPFIELGVGFNPELTGRENVYLSASLMGFSKKEIDKMYQEIVDFAELEKFMDQKLKNYSSGMQVRLGFSIATRAQGDILLIDEVLAVGDADFQRKCYDYFRNLKRLKKTVVFVSHDMNAIREYCDRAVLVEKSKLIETGNSSDVSIAYTKMFADETTNKDKSSDGDRWGDGFIKYTDIALSNHVLKDSDETIILSLSAKAKKIVDVPIFGFVVKDAGGKEVLGTNNSIRKKPIEQVEAGGVVEVTWKIPNIFADGTHTIDVAVSNHDGTVISDWWSDAISFTVVREEKTPYIISPKIGLSISAQSKFESR